MGLFSASIKGFSTESDQVKYALIWRLSLLGMCVLALLTTVFVFDPSNAKYTYFIGLTLCSSGVIYLSLTKNFKVVYLAYAILGSLAIQIDANLTLDTPHLTNYLWILLIIILTIFGSSFKNALVITILNIAGIIYYANFTMPRHYEVMHTVPKLNAFTVGFEMACLCLFISYIIYLFSDLRIKSENQLIEKNNKLEDSYDLILSGNKEKTILVKEIHHRVKNNLQIIVSLLRLQMTEVKNKEAKAHFSEAINRVMVMSSIHQKLYQEKDLTKFSLQEYIEDLSKDLKVFFIEEFDITFNIVVNCDSIDLKTVVPLGLIMNELLSNSFKYAFNEASNGMISININEIENGLNLVYSDSGIWKEISKENTGFGLELIEILTEQLNGTSELIKSKTGTTYSFQFNPDL